MKGSESNNSPKFRLYGWASLLAMAKPGTVARYVVGGGMLGTETCVTEGGFVSSGMARQPFRNCGYKGQTEARRATRSQSGP